MTKYAVTAALLVLSCATLRAAEGGTLFQFNDQRFELKHAYAYQTESPDFDAMSKQADPDKIVFKKTLAIALSDQPFDTQALEKLDEPFDAFDKMVESGAVLVTAEAGKDGAVESLRVVLPRSKQALNLDTGAGTLTLNPPKDGKLSGRLVIKGDKKMHDFDPEHIPLIEADVGFVTSPAR
jgi:hypothetical protein